MDYSSNPSSRCPGSRRIASRSTGRRGSSPLTGRCRSMSRLARPRSGTHEHGGSSGRCGRCGTSRMPLTRSCRRAASRPIGRLLRILRLRSASDGGRRPTSATATEVSRSLNRPRGAGAPAAGSPSAICPMPGWGRRRLRARLFRPPRGGHAGLPMHERQVNDARPGAHAPALSVVIPMPRGFDAIRATVRSLEAQSRRDLLELVVVAPSTRALDLRQPELKWCRHIRVVESGTMTSLGAAYAAGVRGATAPVVAFAEDHSYPAPDWAKALIARHCEPWGAVGPVVANANPGNPFGDAAYYMGYGRWADVISPGEIDDVPGHNSSYKRSVLLDHSSELSALLEVETILHWRLRTMGYRLYLEPAARTNHHNPSSLVFLLKQ